MKAVIYSMYHQAQWIWRVSLDVTLHTDKLFWSLNADASSMLRVVRELPFGQAMDMVAEMRERVIGDTGAAEEQSSMEKNSSIDGQSNVDERLVRFCHDADFWDRLSAAMAGRSLLWEELVSLLEYMGIHDAAQYWKKLVQWAYLNGYVDLHASLEVSDKRRFWGWGQSVSASCRRCGHSGEQIRWTDCAACGESCPYCESCLTMGRTRGCSPLIVGVKDKVLNTVMTTEDRSYDVSMDITVPFVPVGDWRLSPAQLAASEAGIRYLLRKDKVDKPFLIWAVTGAGKTEMIFPLVATELQRGGKVLIATPRRDVVLELLPRVKTAFPGRSVIALYGGSTERWESGDITVATTHQLLRYEGAFDLVVIDEIDAFPYHNNPVLEYAAHKVRTPEGAVVLLSATPPPHLQVDARKGRLSHTKVPVRYHGKPLPLPRLIRYSGLHRLRPSPASEEKAMPWSIKRDVEDQLTAILSDSLNRGAQIFIFVPAIHRLEPALAWVRRRMAKLCSHGHIEATSSQDTDRHEKVMRFRAGDIRILLTTTILERGVTISKADVVVLDADSALFDAAALVQMAGRAGRSAADPYGKVYYLAREHNRAQADAVRQIRAMNRLAERKGYLV
jgi:competence protein ComFA